MNRGDAVEHQRDELGLDFGRLGWLRPDLQGEIHPRQASRGPVRIRTLKHV